MTRLLVNCEPPEPECVGIWVFAEHCSGISIGTRKNCDHGQEFGSEHKTGTLILILVFSRTKSIILCIDRDPLTLAV